MNYTYLIQDERYKIAILLKAGHKQIDIVGHMNRYPSTISRELRRNRAQHSYRSKQAPGLSEAHVRTCFSGPRISATRWRWPYNHERPNMALGGITPMRKLMLAI